MRILLAFNENAGDGGPDLDELVARVRSEGHAVAARSVKEDGWEEALKHDVDLVVAVGGDGTVAHVLRALPGRNLAATLLPYGSANNIARSLGFEAFRTDELVRGWPRAVRGAIDVPTLAWAAGTARFVESAGGGLFAEMLACAEETESEPAGVDSLALGLKLLRRLVEELPARDWDVEADGSDLSGEFVAVEALNIRQIGPNVEAAASADPADRMLDLLLVREDDRKLLAEYVEERLEGNVEARLQVPTRRAREVTFGMPPGGAVHFDDELVTEIDAGVRFVASVEDRVEVLLPRG